MLSFQIRAQILECRIMTDRIITFGYEGLSLEAFIARLRAAGVETVVDVRANPLSCKRGFSKRSLAAALEEAGFVYVHMPVMGCPKPVRDRYKQDADWPKYTLAASLATFEAKRSRLWLWPRAPRPPFHA
jgi:hypothetical protein